MRSSSRMTRLASSMSWWCSASITRLSVATTMSSASSVCSSRRASSSWKCTRVWSCAAMRLAELAGDVILGALVHGIGEEPIGRRVLDHVTGAVLGLGVKLDREEGGHLGDARGLLHVVGDDHDRVELLELEHEVLDARRRDRVQGRAGLV